MPIFTDIDHIKTFIGGAINVSIEMDSITPIIERTAHNHLLSQIGAPLWDDMVAVFGGSPTAEQTALFPYLQRPLAMLSFYEYSKIGAVQFSETGLHRMENDSYKSAYKYQENDYRSWMLMNGYEEIERLLIFLQTNKADYPLWAGTAFESRNTALVINYARDFRLATDKELSRYTFEILRSIIEDVEVFSMIPNMGEPQFDDIKSKIAAETVLSSEETELLRLMQKAVANFAIEEAVKTQLVRLEGRNVVQSESLEPQSSEKKTTPGNAMASMKIRHHNEWANRHISNMNRYLEDNRVTFTLYDTWKTAIEAAEAAAAAAEDTNCFDLDCTDTSRCFCVGSCTCSCSSKSGKSIIRL